MPAANPPATIERRATRKNAAGDRLPKTHRSDELIKMYRSRSVAWREHRNKQIREKNEAREEKHLLHIADRAAYPDPAPARLKQP